MKNIIYLLLCFLLVASCNKDKNEIFIEKDKSGNIGIRSDETSSLIPDRTRLAKGISIAINDPIFFKFLSDSLLQSKLKEAELLYVKVKDLTIPTLNVTVADFLIQKEASLADPSMSVSASEFYHNYFAQTDPLASLVLMPGQGHNYNDIRSRINLQQMNIYVDKIFDEFHAGESIPFLHNGLSSSLGYDKNNEPTIPYLAIKHNEEYIAFYSSNHQLFYQSDVSLESINGIIDIPTALSSNARIYSNGDIIVARLSPDGPEGPGGPGSGDGGTGDPCTEPCTRDCFDGKDAISRISFTNDYEGWPRGGPEFMVQGVMGLQANIVNTTYGFVATNTNMNNIYSLYGDENKWYYKTRDGIDLIDKQFVKWTIPDRSKDWVELWTEQDGKLLSFKVSPTFKVEVLGIQTSVNLGETTLSGGDDEVGLCTIEFCDNWDPLDFNPLHKNASWGYEYTVGNTVTFCQKDRGY